MKFIPEVLVLAEHSIEFFWEHMTERAARNL